MYVARTCAHPKLEYIENAVRDSATSPGKIVATLSELDNSTVISPKLLSILDRIAEQHGGTIPLHGRLFGQWMHNMFPADCKYPQLSGQATVQSMKEYEIEAGVQAIISIDDIANLVMTMPQAPDSKVLKENNSCLVST